MNNRNLQDKTFSRHLCLFLALACSLIFTARASAQYDLSGFLPPGVSVNSATPQQIAEAVTAAVKANPDAAADIAAGFAVTANDTIITAAGSAAAILQVGGEGDSFNQITVNFNDLRLTTTNSDTDIAALRTALDNYNSSQTQATAESLLNSVDAALNSVSSQRSELGAKQNRLGYTISSVMAASENVASARSRIVDADFAMETANLTRNQILQQAGTAMLAQANSLPQNVLALLQ